MLTTRQNLLEVIKGGNPDRFIKQYEAFKIVGGDPVGANNPRATKGGPNIIDNWGVTRSFPANVPAAFPVHDEEHKVVKDVTKWKEVVKAPKLDYPESDWQTLKANAEAVDRNEYFCTVFRAPGIFEQLHHLMGIDSALMNFYEEPEAMHELIDYIVDWMLRYAELIVKYAHPDAIFHHDDWGSQISSFMSPEMFQEFIVPGFKKVYGYYKANGVQLIVHHSDSYAANLVPYMIEMGIDIWQGAMSTNDIPALIKQYGSQITFMGDIDNGIVDREDWTYEKIKEEVAKSCKRCGKLYFIPSTTMGLPESLYKGVYDAVNDAIDEMSKEMF
ncbi:methylcobalamin:coenzyme M methyltransferase [Oxobacter pfennigii]|uniref:Methylcobalamin:coenzyme M methyltransferase n=1 Tax=Oxobacter pfennigii TaxID=36849 RepID=A0A0P8YEF5_9CLOT|nr:uroporphyrinogen decarboxylase family protein [Oxobacter pfennigii]KPU45593.1 methylcobalamin:coenzyme M methyltransferase [Oxobacter pfennigii]